MLAAPDVQRQKGYGGMDNDETWYRQLLALVLLSVSRAAVEFITNPSSKEDASKQLRGAFESIDYDAAAKAVTGVIDTLASSSKTRLSGTIDTLRDKSVDAVDEAKTRAEKQLAPKRGGRKGRLVLGLLLGGLIAYFLLDEQRRDDLIDRLTGASGPIQQATSSVYQQAASGAQQAAGSTPDSVRDSAQRAADATQQMADQASTDTQV
jgi:hypothetical protein